MTEDEFVQLVTTERAGMIRWVVSRGVRPPDAEDVVAEAVADAATKYGAFRGACPPNAWLWSFVRLELAGVWRKKDEQRENLRKAWREEVPMPLTEPDTAPSDLSPDVWAPSSSGGTRCLRTCKHR
jgi:DNA-directed RNA polymerase specialized sigma24 family protein